VLKLTIEDDEGKTTVVPLARDEITIGRLEGNTIRLTERNVSRRHARLVRQNGALYIEDLASFTGVRVNGAKIATATPLREGDEVQIGDYRLALRGERTTAQINDRVTAGGDRPTMPSVPAIAPPMGTVGGSVAIPTRASVAAMAAQPIGIASPPPGALLAVPAEVAPVETAPMASGTSSREATPAPTPVLTPPGTPPTPIPAQGAPPTRKSPVVPHPLTGPAPQPLAGPAPQPLAAAPAPQSVATPAPQTVAAAPAPQSPAAAPAPPPLGGHTPAYRVTPAAPAAPKLPQPSPPAAAARPAAQAQVVAPVPDVSDAQPTIPIRALGDSVPDRTAGTAPARMFVLTTDLAGMEFSLDRASLVIGRTDENDIVLGHRSISRHHAKIVRDGDHYTIVDLQSANGVRVNGEDYERIELNPGDIIELGHVKLRFVGPFETFVFKPPSLGMSLQSKVYIATGALALGVVALMMWRKHHASEAPPPVVAAAPAPAPAPPPAPSPAASPAPEPAPAATPAAIFAEAKQAAGAEDWEKSRVALDKLGLAIEDPSLRRDAAALRRRVDTERQGALLFAQFDEASAAKNYAEAMARYDQIPADSVYKRRAKPRYDEARTLLVAEHVAAADKARTAGRCAEVRTEVAEIARLDPRNMMAREMIRLCKPRPEPTHAVPAAAAAPVTAVAARPARPRPSPALAPTDTAPRPERAPEPPAEADAPDPEALMKQAREAWLRQQCGAAVDLSRKALHAKPGMTDAYQIIAVCSCTLKDADAAARAYAKLDDKNRNLVRALCQKNGVVVGVGD
jgi:pSer/pThr/pTyr-binding forkhead associated (FHA) protein